MARRPVIIAPTSLGATVRATDPRPEVADQVRSLSGEYLAISSPEVEVSATGYAQTGSWVPGGGQASASANAL